MKGCKLKESDMFLPLKEYFEGDGHDVYAEVPCYGRTADIVAVKGQLITVVETKTSMNIKLLEQVFEWRHLAHYVYAAVPNKTEISNWTRELLSNAGIGIICLDFNAHKEMQQYCGRVYKRSKAKLFRKIGFETYRGFQPVRWDQHIIPEFSQNISGVRQGDVRISRYKLMMDHVKHIISNHADGISIDELVDVLDTYYANPKIGLYNALKYHESDWCNIFKKPGDRKTYVRMKSEPVNA